MDPRALQAACHPNPTDIGHIMGMTQHATAVQHEPSIRANLGLLVYEDF
jgi:hypothetical protein